MNVLGQHGLVRRFVDSYVPGSLSVGEVVLLKDFVRWAKNGAGQPKVRDLDYRQIGSWIAGYRLPHFATDHFPAHYNSKLAPSHALIIWQLHGSVSAPQLAKAFAVDVKAIRNIWSQVSWRELTTAYED